MRYWFQKNSVWIEQENQDSPLLSLLQALSGYSAHTSAGDSSGISDSYAFSVSGNFSSGASVSFSCGNKKKASQKPFIISVVGAGGKTSLIHALLEECRKMRKKALVTTTTHMFLPEALLTRENDTYNPDQDITFLGNPVWPEIFKNGYLKCTAPSFQALKKFGKNKDIILIESDGSRRFPIKIPGEWEPVILDESNLILTVYGLSSLDHPISSVCQRWERVSLYPELKMGTLGTETISAENLSALMRECYLKPLQKKYPHSIVIPVWNQADDNQLLTKAKIAAEKCGNRFQLITALKPEERNTT